MENPLLNYTPRTMMLNNAFDMHATLSGYLLTNVFHCSVLRARQEQEQTVTAKEVEVKEVCSDTLVAPLDFSFLHLTTIEGKIGLTGTLHWFNWHSTLV